MKNTKLAILKTEKDKNGFEISQMSNFWEIFSNNFVSENFEKGKKYSFNIENAKELNALTQFICGCSKIKYTSAFVADLDSIPIDIKNKVRKGIYKIGKSKQVAGNYRPTILDENNVRVKDITLKKINKLDVNPDAFVNMQIQMQLAEISRKLDSIKHLQSYQIDRFRDSTIFVPFFNARDCILNAQNSDNFEEQTQLLKKASDILGKAYNEAFCEIATDYKYLAKIKGASFKQDEIDMHIKHIAEDIQMLTIITGMKINIFNYLGESKIVCQIMEKFQSNLMELANKRDNEKSLSVFELMHDNCCYSKKDKNFWYNFANGINKNLDPTKCLKYEEIILIKMGDVQNEIQNM